MREFSDATVRYSSSVGIDLCLPGSADLVCLSHLKWEVLRQQPQHLTDWCEGRRRVFFVEEPVFELIASWWIEVTQRDGGVWVVVPHLPNWVSEGLETAMRQSLMDELFETYGITNPILWYFTPAALSFSNHLQVTAIVYECIDASALEQSESTSFRELEPELLKQADVVFTGGQSLYETKQCLQSNASTFANSRTSISSSPSLSVNNRN